MEVEVNGERAPSYDCLTEKLKPAGGGLAAKGDGDVVRVDRAATLEPAEAL